VGRKTLLNINVNANNIAAYKTQMRSLEVLKICHIRRSKDEGIFLWNCVPDSGCEKSLPWYFAQPSQVLSTYFVRSPVYHDEHLPFWVACAIRSGY